MESHWESPGLRQWLPAFLWSLKIWKLSLDFGQSSPLSITHQVGIPQQSQDSLGVAKEHHYSKTRAYVDPKLDHLYCIQQSKFHEMSGPFLFRVIQAYVAGVQLPFLRSATLNPPGRISSNAVVMMMMMMMMMMMSMSMSMTNIVRKRRTIMIYDKAVILLTWSTIPTLQPMTSWCSFHSLQLATHALTNYSSHQTKIFVSRIDRLSLWPRRPNGQSEQSSIWKPAATKMHPTWRPPPCCSSSYDNVWTWRKSENWHRSEKLDISFIILL